MSYADFQKWLDYEHAEYPFYGNVVAKMKDIAGNMLRAVRGQIDPERMACNF
jgi:hypothetical protein